MSTEPTEKCKEWILNVIDQLRKRKARPDLERICHFVERKYGLDKKETQAYVEKLVDMGVVIKVVYKRGTSYRNATKSRKRGYGSNVLNSNFASRKISEAVTHLLNDKRQLPVTSHEELSASGVKEESNLTEEEVEGVSLKEIEDWIEEQIDSGEIDSLNYPLRLVVQREVDAKRLARLENGNYVPRSEDKPAPSVAQPRPQLQKSVSVIQSKRGRPPKRKLNIARSFSCNDVAAEHHEVAPVPVMPPHLCDFCQQTAASNKTGLPEELLFCKDCNAKAHPSCMQYSPELASRARNTAWQCIDCKTCCICSDPGEADCMLFCDACDKGYHMNCHAPPVDDKPTGKWICSECVMDGVDIEDIEENYNVVDSTVRSTDTESIASQKASLEKMSFLKSRSSTSPPPRKKIKVEVEEEPYPACASWSSSDVTDFFRKQGFLEQATAFTDQEIDGQSLLLLKRSDVLQGLSLKLGPALKIYNHVMKLQTAGHSSLDSTRLALH